MPRWRKVAGKRNTPEKDKALFVQQRKRKKNGERLVLK